MATRLPRRILLTGGTGTLGKALLELLSGYAGIRVLVLLRKGGRFFPKLPGVRQQTVDYGSADSLARAFASFRPDAVVHAAATGMETPRPPFLSMVEANVIVPVRLLHAAARYRGLHFVMMGTGLAYRDQGRPLREEDPLATDHPYAATKAAADLLMRSAAPALDVRLTVLRPFSFTGPGDEGTRLFPSILRAAAGGKKISLTGDGRFVTSYPRGMWPQASLPHYATHRHPPLARLSTTWGAAKPFPCAGLSGRWWNGWGFTSGWVLGTGPRARMSPASWWRIFGGRFGNWAGGRRRTWLMPCGGWRELLSPVWNSGSRTAKLAADDCKQPARSFRGFARL